MIPAIPIKFDNLKTLEPPPDVSFSFDPNKNYSLYLKEDTIEILDPDQRVVALQNLLDHHIYNYYYQGPAYVIGDTCFFVLGSRRHSEKYYLYSFDKNSAVVTAAIGPLGKLQFVDNLLVEFDTSCNDDIPETPSTITIYDLTRPQGKRTIKRHTLEGRDWNCTIYSNWILASHYRFGVQNFLLDRP